VGVSGLLAAVDEETAAAGAAGGPADGRGIEMAVDGISGTVFTRPTAAELDALRERREAALLQGELARGFRDRPAQTKDGHRVRLLANIGKPADVPRALEANAEGIGLFRTEFLFMGRQSPPTEDEQMDAYHEVFAAFGPDRPVVVRLADIGGDKNIPYLHLPHEANPFLGVRAIRLAYADRSLLMTQIRAISRAAAAARVEPHIMAPMVATLADVDLLNAMIRDAQAELAADGLPAAPHIVTGIMVEVPSAAILARELAAHVDFFSIGTNDLTQYLLAADRTNAALTELQDALHPAVVRSIRMVTGAAAAAGRPVAVCGELAGDPAGALVLVGLGVGELSADAGSLDALRYHLAAVTHEQLQHLAARALGARDAAEVRALAMELVELRPAATPERPPA
jgi:phosphoenolpyruvate-protein phosphotransferase